MKNRNLLIITFVSCLVIGSLPASANLQGGISKHHFFDTQKTIMSDLKPNNTLKTGKYWDKNLFYTNKYRPLFMLSNKELYKLMPQENESSIVQRIITPSVYNVSLKNASITTVSLTSQPKLPKKIAAYYPPVITHKEVKNTLSEVQKQDFKALSAYENVKENSEDMNSKVNAAVMLKDTSKSSNYTLALGLLNEVTAKEPYNAEAFSVKGDLYYMKGDMENAMKNYAQSLKINPYCKKGCLGIAKILEQTDKVLAQKYLDRANSIQ